MSSQEMSSELSLTNGLSFTEVITFCKELFSHPEIRTLFSHPKYLLHWRNFQITNAKGSCWQHCLHPKHKINIHGSYNIRSWHLILMSKSWVCSTGDDLSLLSTKYMLVFLKSSWGTKRVNAMSGSRACVAFFFLRFNEKHVKFNPKMINYR